MEKLSKRAPPLNDRYIPSSADSWARCHDALAHADVVVDNFAV